MSLWSFLKPKDPKTQPLNVDDYFVVGVLAREAIAERGYFGRGLSRDELVALIKDYESRLPAILERLCRESIAQHGRVFRPLQIAIRAKKEL